MRFLSLASGGQSQEAGEGAWVEKVNAATLRNANATVAVGKRRKCKCAAERWKGPERESARCESALSRIDDKLGSGNTRLKASLKCSASRTSIGEACCSSQVKREARLRERSCPSATPASHCPAGRAEAPSGRCDEASQVGNSLILGDNCTCRRRRRRRPTPCCDTELNAPCSPPKQAKQRPAQPCAATRKYQQLWKRLKRACSTKSTASEVLQVYYNRKCSDKSVNTCDSRLGSDCQVDALLGQIAGILNSQKAATDRLDSCGVQTDDHSPCSVTFLDELVNGKNVAAMDEQPQPPTDDNDNKNNKKSNGGFFKAFCRRYCNNSNQGESKERDKPKDEKADFDTGKESNNKDTNIKLTEKERSTDDNYSNISKSNNAQNKCIGTDDGCDIILQHRKSKHEIKIENINNGVLQRSVKKEKVSTLKEFDQDQKCTKDNSTAGCKSKKVIMDCQDFVFCQCSRGKTRCSKKKLKACNCRQDIFSRPCK